MSAHPRPRWNLLPGCLALFRPVLQQLGRPTAALAANPALPHGVHRSDATLILDQAFCYSAVCPHRTEEHVVKALPPPFPHSKRHGI